MIVFILGVYRSGTSILGDLVSSFKDVVYWYEPFWLRKEWAGKYINGSISNSEKEVLRNTVFSRSKYHIVIKSPAYTGAVLLLADIFPNAKFLYIHRDPELVARSILKFTWWDKIEEPEDYYAIPLEKIAEFEKGTPFEKAYILRRSLHEKLLRDSEFIIDRVMIFSHEDLLRSPGKMTSDISEFLGIETSHDTKRVIETVYNPEIKRGT